MKNKKFYFHPAFLAVLAASLFLNFYREYLIMWFVMLAHEAGHLLAAKAMRLKVRVFKIMPFGAEIRFYNHYRLKEKKEIIVAASGPFVNLLLALFAVVFGIKTEATLFFAVSNASVLVLNLLPVLPLDGGRIMKAVLCRKYGRVESERYVLIISRLFDALLLLTGFALLYYTRFNFSLLLIGVFVLFYIFDENKNYALMEKKAALDYKSKLREKNSLPTRNISAKSNASASRLLNDFNYKDFCTVNVLDKNFSLWGVLTEAEIVDYLTNIDSSASLLDILKFSIASWDKAL